jgi:uncharacterized protein (DUF486 family)
MLVVFSAAIRMRCDPGRAAGAVVFRCRRSRSRSRGRMILPLIPLEEMSMRWLPIAQTAGLLTLSNCFMTYAWYGHLRTLENRPWYVAAVLSWMIAFFEYLLQVPGNRIGFTELSLPQLKIMQEVITLTVFVPFAWFYMHSPLKLDYLYAAVCMLGAVYFIFRG